MGDISGLYKVLPDSSDWEKVPFFKDQIIHSVNVIDTIAFVSSNSSLYRSDDNLRTWTYCELPALHSDLKNN
jgi:hypothetical protein